MREPDCFGGATRSLRDSASICSRNGLSAVKARHIFPVRFAVKSQESGIVKPCTMDQRFSRSP